MNISEILPLLGKRRESFEIVLEKLSNKKNPLILETGCARIENNFIGDGMSTIIFDKYIEQYGGECFSVDINFDSISLAKKLTNKVNLICGDSVTYLINKNNELRQQNKYIDLLYLDSFDLDVKNPHPSAMHHIFELISIWPSCHESTIIMVDDNLPNGIGKGIYIKDFMNHIGIMPIFDEYQIIWELNK